MCCHPTAFGCLNYKYANKGVRSHPFWPLQSSGTAELTVTLGLNQHNENAELTVTLGPNKHNGFSFDATSKFWHFTACAVIPRHWAA